MPDADAAEEIVAESTLSPQKIAIIDAARELFVKYGYEGLSIRDLAAQCGLAKATIYHHFHDKQDIFLSVVQLSVLAMHDRIVKAAAAEQEPLDRLRAVVEAYCDMLVERRSIFFWSLRANAETEDQLRLFFSTHKDLFIGPLVRVLQEGVDAGLLRTTNVQMSAICLLGMLNASMTYRIMLDEATNTAEVAAYTLDLFLSGVIVKQSE